MIKKRLKLTIKMFLRKQIQKADLNKKNLKVYIKMNETIINLLQKAYFNKKSRKL